MRANHNQGLYSTIAIGIVAAATLGAAGTSICRTIEINPRATPTEEPEITASISGNLDDLHQEIINSAPPSFNFDWAWANTSATKEDLRILNQAGQENQWIRLGDHQFQGGKEYLADNGIKIYPTKEKQIEAEIKINGVGLFLNNPDDGIPLSHYRAFQLAEAEAQINYKLITEDALQGKFEIFKGIDFTKPILPQIKLKSTDPKKQFENVLVAMRRLRDLNDKIIFEIRNHPPSFPQLRRVVEISSLIRRDDDSVTNLLHRQQ